METERLYLRQRTRQRLKHILDQSISEQLTFFGFENVNELRSELAKIEKHLATENTDRTKWDLVEKSTQLIIGSCSFFNWAQQHERAEIGYSLFEKYRGKGFMHEALKRIIDYGFGEMRLNRIEAFMEPGNEPSKRMIKKLGFKQEGVLREHYRSADKIHDSIVFSLLRSDYQQE